MPNRPPNRGGPGSPGGRGRSAVPNRGRVRGGMQNIRGTNGNNLNRGNARPSPSVRRSKTIDESSLKELRLATSEIESDSGETCDENKNKTEDNNNEENKEIKNENSSDENGDNDNEEDETETETEIAAENEAENEEEKPKSKCIHFFN